MLSGTLWKNGASLANLMWKACSIHFSTSFNLVSFTVSTIIMIINLVHPSFFSLKTSAIISGVWSWPFVVCNLLVGVLFLFVFRIGTGIIRYITGYTKPYTYIQLLFEMYVNGGLVNASFATIPGLWSATRLMFTEKLRYIVAPKPITSE